MRVLQLEKHMNNFLQEIEIIREFKIQIDKWEQFLKNKNNIAYIVLKDNKVIGFAWGYILERIDDESMLYIHSIDVLQEFRNQGAGTLLVQAFLDYAKKLKLRNTFLITDKGNINANKLYQKFTKEIEDDKVLYIFK